MFFSSSSLGKPSLTVSLPSLPSQATQVEDCVGKCLRLVKVAWLDFQCIHPCDRLHEFQCAEHTFVSSTKLVVSKLREHTRPATSLLSRIWERMSRYCLIHYLQHGPTRGRMHITLKCCSRHGMRRGKAPHPIPESWSSGARSPLTRIYWWFSEAVAI